MDAEAIAKIYAVLGTERGERNIMARAILVAIDALHEIQIPDYVLKNDVLHMHNELKLRMAIAKEALEKIRGVE